MSTFCTFCGAALEEGRQFCGSCGKPVQGSGTEGAPLVQTSAPAPGSAPAKSRPELWVYSILLGWLGVHCFVTGKKKRGTLELLLGLLIVAFSVIGFLRATVPSPPPGSDTFPFIDGFSSEYIKIVLFQSLPFIFWVISCVFWIPDLIGIAKGTFENGPDKVPGFINVGFRFINVSFRFINVGLPEWKFTKKHLVFIVLLALLVELQIVTGNDFRFPILLPLLLGVPFLLCGVFFGPFWGTAITGGLSLIGLGTLLGLIIIPRFAGGYNLWSFFGRRLYLPHLRFFRQELLYACITSFVSGYIVYGVSKIRAAWNEKVVSKIMQGLLMGITVLVGRLAIGMVLFKGGLGYAFKRFFPFTYGTTSAPVRIIDVIYVLLQTTLAGVLGVLLPLALAKKGMLLGPFVKEGEQAPKG
jgi:hypothetical protein